MELTAAGFIDLGLGVACVRGLASRSPKKFSRRVAPGWAAVRTADGRMRVLRHFRLRQRVVLPRPRPAPSVKPLPK